LLWKECITPVFKAFYKNRKFGDKIRLSPKPK
jgi:hypothetical protein